MSLKIIKAGIQDTVQDMGRYGYQSLGINPGGAMDRFSARVANLLTGNMYDKAVIELYFPASVFLFKQPALIAISGADFSPSINGEKIPSNHPVLVNKNSILQFHKAVKGARAYLSIYGGVEVPLWLQSSSTNLKAGIGGFSGRAFQKEDELKFKVSDLVADKIKEKEFYILPWQANDSWGDTTGEVYVLPGHEWERLTSSSKENFLMTSYVITNQSDRMGYRLNNIPLNCLTNEEVISSAVSFGTVQLLPDGRLIILMADHQTAGGYPRIAHVISAHHNKLAQMKAGDKIHFRITDQKSAEELMIKQQQHLQQLQNACTFRLQEFFNT
jgi:antagonist of KipI